MSEGKAHELNEVGSESFSSEVGYQYSSPHKLVSSSKKRLTSAILIVFAIVIVVLLFPSKT